MIEDICDPAYSVLNAVTKFVYDIENIVDRYVEYVAYDIRHFFFAVSPLVAVRLSVQSKVRKRSERNFTEIFSYYFFYGGLAYEDVFKYVRYDYIIYIVLQKYLV